ncbi:MAG: lysophospholipase [Oscillospiraceae bacterium]|nr:lysophospholipase [Oscillospiraceae bacterium]
MHNFQDVKLKAKDGANISAISLGIDSSDKKGIVVICHGFGEHASSYKEFMERLWQSGYASIAHDQRGHGKPPEGVSLEKWQGIIKNYQSFVDDISSIIDYLNEQAKGVPLVMYGHSMGGNIAANALLRLPSKQLSLFSCAVLESPWLELYKPLSPAMLCGLRVLNVFCPNLVQKIKFNVDSICSEDEKQKAYTSDMYYHGVMSVRLICGMTDSCAYALSNAEKLSIKTFLAIADNELVLSNDAMHRFADKAGDIVTVKMYKSNHAIHNDVSQEEYCDDLIAFLEENI